MGFGLCRFYIEVIFIFTTEFTEYAVNIQGYL